MSIEDGSGGGDPPPAVGQDPDGAPTGPVKAEAGVDWLYVLTAPVTNHRDKMMVMDLGDVSIAPVFRSRAEGESFLKILSPPEEYSVQAMHLTDIKEFADSQGMVALVLDGEGRLVGENAEWPSAREGGGGRP
jgi:hypothetical protein